MTDTSSRNPAEDVLASQAFSVFIGAEMTDFGDGNASMAIDILPHHLQQNGYVHGGVIAYLADNTATFAGATVLGPRVVTSALTITYLRPGIGDKLVARAHVVDSTRRQAVVHVDVFAATTAAPASAAPDAPTSPDAAAPTERRCASAQATIVMLPEGR
ncbi:hypothetical protein ALI44B_08215 [Leifsonia sp. ALI-44-B]|jgi:uncharacterized protein (TIGR00369 family)|uniref:PaaI family thioesterase n=1 Tax=Leifsonia sp. ALI-44-B TaxID=1933776 RepID=UPI00097C6008|nr:PaaI family thioesterase [Leifsonia sp. ALI-44-B]ONI60578.1 hypothetical protein ALI44B_08215 [Leifsonia sp. ALI-44-B]